MNWLSRIHTNRYSKAAYVVLLIIVAYVAALFIARVRLETFREQAQAAVTEQQAVLVEIAEITGRNGGDESADVIVHDCAVDERVAFDDLLGRLNDGLSQSDLTKLDRLFGRCGTFHAERKALMVARLERELEVFTTFVDGLAALTVEDEQKKYMLATWRELVEEEKKQSALYTSLVTEQDKIITTLLSGKRAESAEMKAVLEEARETRESLLMSNQQAAILRGEIMPQ
ncbi:MAG: hypothetical protein RLZZ480_81 [Candidatus Parcubacteria bacterium]|jgi:hypothetical protein